MDGPRSVVAPIGAKVYEAPEVKDTFALPDEPIQYEVLALNSLVIDLVKIVGAIAPGALDQVLSVARLRLQMLERGEPEVVVGERLAYQQKITILERALGRTPTVA